MPVLVSKLTSKGQTTIPEELRSALGLETGQRIAWQVQGDVLVGRRVRSLTELYGALKAEPSPATSALDKAFEEAAVSRHKRISKTSS